MFYTLSQFCTAHMCSATMSLCYAPPNLVVIWRSLKEDYVNYMIGGIMFPTSPHLPRHNMNVTVTGELCGSTYNDLRSRTPRFPRKLAAWRVYNVCPASEWTFKLCLVLYLASSSPIIMRVQGMSNTHLDWRFRLILWL